jgi:L-threonylcarbamoyladenylate synthase
MSDIEMVNCYVENISETAVEFLSDSNPTTVIFSNTKGKNTNQKSIAVRIPYDNFCLNLIKELKHPLSSTSANLHGFEVPNSLERIDKLIKDNVDYIVRTSKIFNNKPSRIIKMIGDNEFEVIR